MMQEFDDNTTPGCSSGNLPSCDTKYLALVGVLMIVIIGLLAVLWVHERTRRIAAERDAIRLQQKLEQFQSVLGPLLSEPTEEQPATAPGE